MVKGWACRPGRVWVNSTGRPRRKRTSNATTAITGDNKTSPTVATTRSMARFTLSPHPTFEQDGADSGPSCSKVVAQASVAEAFQGFGSVLPVLGDLDEELEESTPGKLGTS